MSCGQDNRGALHTFSISFAFAYSQVRSSTMSKQSLEEAVKLRNTAAYNLKVSVLSKVEGAYSIEQFTINWDRQQVICPQGNISTTWTPQVDAHGHPSISVKFRPKDCELCAARSLCTRAKT